MKTCPKCQTEWPDSARFCPKDGTPIPDPVVETQSDVEADADLEDVSMEATSDADLDDVSEPASSEGQESAAAPAKDAVVLTPEEEEKLDQQRMHGFSETQWFMLAQDPDKLKDSASTQDLYDMQDDYDWDEEIPEEERSKFSLRGKKEKQDK